MYSTPAGSESSLDLYSGSDTDEPLDEHGYGSQKQSAGTKGSRSSQDAEVERMEATGNTPMEQTEMPRALWGPMEFEKDGPQDKILEVSSAVHKRKRSHDDNGRTHLNENKSSGDSAISAILNGHMNTKPSSPRLGFSESTNLGSTIKRNRPNNTTLRVPPKESVGEVSPNRHGLTSFLPIQIWQHVFCFVPPVFLGRLLRVNRTFHSLLNPDYSPLPRSDSKETGIAVFQNAETIWAASRRRFAPGLPKPLHGVHELNMWRLMRGNNCQFCGEKSRLLTSSITSNPWQSGPGNTGVRVIWPFGVRCCSKCLKIHSEKEVTLLFSSTFPSFLLPALPFAFISQSDHFVASVALRNTYPPADVQLTKYYYKVDVDKIKCQLDEARELGSGSAEEWIKGLEAEGQERCNDAVRWEQWEAKGGLKKVNSRPNTKIASSLSRPVPGSVPTTATDIRHLNCAVVQGNPHANQAGSISYSEATIQSSTVTLSPLAFTTNAAHGHLPQRPQAPAPQLRPERNIHDVNEAKAARRAEIERRCLALDPPLGANVLSHMESFQAALQISTILTVDAWEMLKPRLLAQREAAEQRENERIQQTLLLQVRSEERKNQETQLKAAKELLDKEWDSVQAPIRDCLATYADEIIQSHWGSGSCVTKDTCPKFAADVLLYAQHRFYDDIAQSDKAKCTAGESTRTNSLCGGPSRKLILENMKWLFDNKVKTFTEPFQKDLFLCNGCEGNFKLYGFEGVIQHYAAKHTTALSVGSVVVHWRAEWPERPPFNPNPSTARATYYTIPALTPTTMQSQYSRPPQTSNAYNEYGQTAIPTAQPHIGGGTQFSPAPCQVQHPVQLQNGHHQPPPISSHYSHVPSYDALPTVSHSGTQFFAPHPEHPVGLTNHNQSYSQHQGIPAQHHLASSIGHTYPQAVQQPAYAEGYQPQYSGLTYPPLQLANLTVQSMPPYIPHLEATYPPIYTLGSDLYRTQMNEMALQAREVWFATSGIKDIPQSVRIYVVIHHVISRFEQKYTNEPSLSMFIDGLDHSAPMRPVRSLNGLACKTCVTLGSGSSDAFLTHPQHLTTDRKLYTLPHLLNHFRSVHVEKVRSNLHLQGGLEYSRLDWKHDMIELPETPSIADLINTPGMDNSKLQLVAAVFPGVFPDPLPSVGSVRNSGSLPKHGMGHNAGPAQRYHRDAASNVAQASSRLYNVSPRKEEPMQSRPESLVQSLSRSSTRASEPPGDDEYDPNRPAYYGKIVDSRQVALNKQRSQTLPITNIIPTEQTALAPKKSIRNEINPNTFQMHSSHDSKVMADVSYGDQQQRRHNDPRVFEVDFKKGSPSAAISKIEKIPNRGSRTDADRYVSEDGEVVEEPPSIQCRSASRGADVTAAERFLNTFDPESKDDQAPDRRDLGMLSRSFRQRTTEIPTVSPFDPVNKAVETTSRRQLNMYVEHSMRSTSSFTDRVDAQNSENTRHIQAPSEHPHPRNTQPKSVSQIRYPYHDEMYSDPRLSPRAHDARGGSCTAHAPPSAAERVPSVPRNMHYPTQWPQDVPRRSRSGSPIQLTRGMQQIRGRSPRQMSPQGAMYHVSSPSVPRNTYPQRLVHYTHPSGQDALSHAWTSNYPTEQYEQQAEYIPITSDEYGYQDQSRYVIAQPLEQRRPVDHTRLERGFVGEEVFERDGQLYYTARRPIDPRPANATLLGNVEYRSDVR